MLAITIMRLCRTGSNGHCKFEVMRWTRRDSCASTNINEVAAVSLIRFRNSFCSKFLLYKQKHEILWTITQDGGLSRHNLQRLALLLTTRPWRMLWCLLVTSINAKDLAVVDSSKLEDGSVVKCKQVVPDHQHARCIRQKHYLHCI